jgi:hypothetical protein
MQKTVFRAGSREKGISILVVTLTLMVIVPLVGLAVDLSMLYLIRTKLLSATDAAVLAGARALSRGADAAAQRVSAQTAATKFFNANFPAGYWGSSNLNFPTVTVDDTTVANYRSVTATARVDAPLYFLRILGQSSSSLRADAQAGRRDALVVLVLDRSSSMDGSVPGTTTTACEIMKTDAVEFVKYFAANRDQVGLVVFSSGQFTYQSRTDFNTADASGKTVSSLIAGIDCKDNTASAEALHAAYAEVRRVNSNTRANVIVFMTDGRPNGVTGNFIPYRISPCGTVGTPMIGVLSQWAGNAAGVGTTAGLMKRTMTDVSGPTGPSAEGTGSCRFTQPPSNPDLTRVHEDVSRMPDNDVYGNSLRGPYITGVTLTRVDTPTEITKASANALDNQATAVRTDGKVLPTDAPPTRLLKTMIYTLGLYGNGAVTDQPDDQLLKKMANDPSLAQDAPSDYQAQKAQPRGMYVAAPDATQLQGAFDTIANYIVVRLSL